MLRLGLPKLWVVLGWELCEGRHKIGLGIGLGLVWGPVGGWEGESLDTSDFGASI